MDCARGHMSGQSYITSRNMAEVYKERNKKMKKSVLLVVALCMVIAVLTGCGSANKDQSKAIASVTAEVTSSGAEAPAAARGTEMADNKYTVYVVDAESEAPLAGVKVQFCSDTQCMMGKTDENGCAVFMSDPGNYTAHILKAPEGYAKTGEEAVMTKDVHTATFKLNKAN